MTQGEPIGERDMDSHAELMLALTKVFVLGRHDGWVVQLSSATGAHIRLELTRDIRAAEALGPLQGPMDSLLRGYYEARTDGA